MKDLKKVILGISLILLVSCLGDTKRNTEESLKGEFTISLEKQAKKDAEAEKITDRLCQDFPQELIMRYNTGAKRVEIERVELILGKLAHCKIKLFYGDKEHEYWEGQVGAWASKTANPFAQYNPERNATLYHSVEGFGEKAVYITNMYQLLILKKGIMYSIVPPRTGFKTNTGKENKEIAIEMAKHYKI